MAIQRTEGQKLLNFAIGQALLDKLNLFFRRAGYADRSRFIRDAIIEKLGRHGFIIDPSLANAPSRLGKGGRQRKPVVQINSKADRSPEAQAEAERLAGQMQRKVKEKA